MPPKSPAAAVAASPASPASKPPTAASATLPGVAGATPRGDGGSPSDKPITGVTMQSIMKFLFPPTLEHPESTGRLELFARYGPVDEDGKLRGGIQGGHAHTDGEIRTMITWNTREALFGLFTKPRSTVEVVVDSLMPLAMAHHYTVAEVKKMMREVSTGANGRMDFRALQNVIFERQRQRLQAYRFGVPPVGKSHKVPFQSKAAHSLSSVMRTPRHNEQEAEAYKQKRLHGYATLVARMEDQNESAQVVGNIRLCRDRGDVDDGWDRYCTVRNKGKASYVQARNTAKQTCPDDGTACQYGGCASLLASSMHGLTRR